MIEWIRIQNLLLVEKAELSLTNGFIAITGETGAGKTVIVKALALLAGAKSDTSLVRYGADKAIIEAIIDGQVVRREIPREGRSRAFIEDRLVPLSALSALSLEIVSQSAAIKLRSPEMQRSYLDQFAGLTPPSELFIRVKKLKEEKERLVLEKSQASLLIDKYTFALEEISSASLIPGEEEELFQEIARLRDKEAEAIELSAVSEKLDAALELISDIQNASVKESVASAVVLLQEASFLSSKEIEIDMHLLEENETRLTLINKLRRKYNKTLPELIEYEKQLKTELEHLSSLGTRLEHLDVELQQASSELNDELEKLTKHRTENAEKLSRTITSHLQSLGLTGTFTVKVTKKEPSLSGQDDITFYLRPNPGFPPATLSSQTSGGETSRLMLALICAITQKGSMVFDEIDSNIGGETATLIGEKLARLPGQTICITHFPQVARHAKTHITIAKTISRDLTIAHIKQLDDASRLLELQRMSGKNPLLISS